MKKLDRRKPAMGNRDLSWNEEGVGKGWGWLLVGIDFKKKTWEVVPAP